MFQENLQMLRMHQGILPLVLLVLGALSVFSGPVQAQSCNDAYIVRPADSLSKIALRSYGDAQKWTVVYNVNLNVVGNDPNLIEIGQSLRIPCLEATDDEGTTISADSSGINSSNGETLAEGNTTSNNSVIVVEPEVQSVAADSENTIRFLTGNDYSPFTDQSLPDQGLITDIVATALETNPTSPDIEISWIDDWSLHLNDLLLDHEYDMGFPWLRPDCDTTPENFRCQNYEFSNPVFEMLILLYTHKSRPLIFNSDADITGAVLCRPNGYYTHDLEKDGRLWLTNNVIELKQPATIKECFDMLIEGDVDAVALNEFTGRTAISDLGLSEEVVALENKPLSIEGLHVVVHKDHPRASELMDVFNNSMTALQLSENYSPIIDKHFRNYWTTIDQ